MKTILLTVLLACALFGGACSRSNKPPITEAQATPAPTTPAPTPKSEAEIEVERARELAARAEADKLLVVPSPAPSVGPISNQIDPPTGPVSALEPMNTLDQGKDQIRGPVSGIGVEVVSISGKIIVAEAKTNGKGAIAVLFPAPGTYVLRYTSGPAKGKVIRSINVTEAGSVVLSIPPPSVAP